MAKIVAVAEKPIPLRPEALYTLGKERGSTKVHVLMKTASGFVTLCRRRDATHDARRTHNSKSDITCNGCKHALAGQLEASA